MDKRLVKHIRYDSKSGNLFWIKHPLGDRNNGKIATCLNNQGYLRIAIKGKWYQAHRICWLLFYGKFPNESIDHINGVKTDNRIINLREANKSQNQMNSIKTGKTKLFGVTANKGKFQAQANIDGIKTYLGRFDTEIEAAMIYNLWVFYSKNKFLSRRLNFKEEPQREEMK